MAEETSKEEVPKEETNLNELFGEKRKRKKKVVKDVEEAVEDSKTSTEESGTKEEAASQDLSSLVEENQPEAGTRESRDRILAGFPKFVDRDYTYEELVARMFGLIQRPEEKSTVKIKLPIVHKEGVKKTAWQNFPQVCQSINRPPEHVMQFVFAECASTGSVDGTGRLLIRGRFQPKHIERILRSYILEYIQCHTCKSLDTKLEKENRLLFMKCSACGSNRSVSAIKTGFQAQTRASRRTAAQNA